MNSAFLNSEKVKVEARNLGFSACGLSPAERVEDSHAQRFRKWLSLGYQAEMQYMANHQDMRLHPDLLVPGVKTIVSVALPYRLPSPVPYLSMYAQGEDYHTVLRQRLSMLMQAIGATGRCFVDTAPVLERYWAWRSGVGWIGKDAQLHVPQVGSAVFLGELFVMEEADAYDQPLASSCSDCLLCRHSCPCGALTEEGLDARRCLSYWTIEHRGSLPSDLLLRGKFYGCDRCLMACPTPFQYTRETSFTPSPTLREMTWEDWQQLTPERYAELFRGSAVKRVKYEGLLRNIRAFRT